MRVQAGRQFLHVDFEGRVAQHVFDDAPAAGGRLKELRFFDNLTAWNNGTGTPAESVLYTYDSEGRVTHIDQRVAGVSQRLVVQSYDEHGRIVRIDSPEGAVNYEYDAATGRIVRMFTGPANDPVNDFRYGYDELGRMTSVQVWERNDVAVDADASTPGNQPETTGYRFDKAGNLDRVDLPNGVIADYRWDTLNRLDDLTYYFPDATPNDLSDNDKLAEFDYTVRADGKRTRAVETRWDSGSAQTTQIDWDYNDAGHLIDEVFNHYDDLLDYIDGYTHDLAGNRLQKTHDAGADGSVDETIDYVFDDNDRLLTETKDAPGTANDTTTTYDWGGTGNPATTQTGKTVKHTPTGRLISHTAYAYDLQGRMAQVVIEEYDPAGNSIVKRTTTDFDYDDAGIRVKATYKVEEDTDNDPATALVVTSHTETTYLHDKRNPTGYAEPVVEIHTDLTTGDEIKTVVSTIGPDVIAETTFTPGGATAGETLVLIYDGHGSTRFLTDLAATVAAAFSYDAYGNAVGFTPATAGTSRLYSGEAFDATIAQQYLRARWYDTALGRFNRLDPFVGYADDPQSLHKYLYVHGDPTNGVDPTGWSREEYSLQGIAAHAVFSAWVASNRRPGTLPGAALSTVLPEHFEPGTDQGRLEPDLVDPARSDYFELKPVRHKSQPVRQNEDHLQMTKYDNALRPIRFRRGASKRLVPVGGEPIGTALVGAQLYLVKLWPADRTMNPSKHSGRGFLWYRMDPIDNDPQPRPVPVPVPVGAIDFERWRVRIFEPHHGPAIATIATVSTLATLTMAAVFTGMQLRVSMASISMGF